MFAYSSYSLDLIQVDFFCPLKLKAKLAGGLLGPESFMNKWVGVVITLEEDDLTIILF